MVHDPLFNSGAASNSGATPPSLSGPQDFVGAEPLGGAPAGTAQIDSAKAAAMFAQLLARQNLTWGILGGLAAAVGGALLWAAVTVITRYQIGYMAIGVGFLVGVSVRHFGKGLTTPFGIVGAVFALFGCLLGNLLAVCGMVSVDEGESIIGVTLAVLMQPTVMIELLKATFSPMDLLFYGIAVYEGYKLSFRQVTDEELAELTT